MPEIPDAWRRKYKDYPSLPKALSELARARAASRCAGCTFIAGIPCEVTYQGTRRIDLRRLLASDRLARVDRVRRLT